MRKVKKLTVYVLVCLSVLLMCGDMRAVTYKPGTYVLTKDMFVREKPVENAKKIATMTKGTKIKVTKIYKEKWAKVTTSRTKKTGYVSLRYTKLIKKAKTTSSKSTKSTKKSTTKSTKKSTTKSTKKAANRSVASLLADTKTAKKTNQIITVIPRGGRRYQVVFYQKTKGRWQPVISTNNGRAGRRGLSANRHEGDKTTPIGSFKLTMAFGRTRNPGTKMTYRRITRNSWWGGTKWGKYAQRWYEGKRLAKGGEHLYSYGNVYKYCMNIGFNMNPVIDGKGSCIFLHCAKNDTTSGCVAVPESVMLKFLKKAKNGAYIIIVPSKAALLKY